jgi:hypothetical protein
MATANDRTEHVRAYLEYFRDMGVHEFYRNETLGAAELPVATAAVVAVEQNVPPRLKPDSIGEG